jgi:hypothetical protein
MSDPWDDDAPLVDRLRWHARNDYLSTPVVDALKEAADEIERLRLQVRGLDADLIRERALLRAWKEGRESPEGSDQ